jgi:hypothetical protein
VSARSALPHVVAGLWEDVAPIAPHAANGLGRGGIGMGSMVATSPAPSDETITDWLAIPALRPG